MRLRVELRPGQDPVVTTDTGEDVSDRLRRITITPHLAAEVELIDVPPRLDDEGEVMTHTAIVERIHGEWTGRNRAPRT